MVLKETFQPDNRLHRPIQLGFRWASRQKLQEENRKKEAEVIDFARERKLKEPDSVIVPNVIAQELGISPTTAKKRVRDILKADPSFDLIENERAPRRRIEKVEERLTLENLKSHSSAYRFPEKFRSLGGILREWEISVLTSSAAEILEENGIEVRILKVNYPKKEYSFNRYIVNKSDEAKIVTLLNGAVTN